MSSGACGAHVVFMHCSFRIGRTNVIEFDERIVGGYLDQMCNASYRSGFFKGEALQEGTLKRPFIYPVAFRTTKAVRRPDRNMHCIYKVL